MNLHHYKIFLLFLIVAMSSVVFGKSSGTLSGHGHSGDITRTLGLNVSNSLQRKLAENITKTFAKYIDSQDDASALNRRIKQIVPGFSLGSYTHRLYFHWGFNGDPRRSVALKHRIKESEASSDQVAMIWDIIIEVQAQRNKGMMDAIKNAIQEKNKKPCELTHYEINALASIVYDVHILGDYVKGTASAQLALQSFDAVVGDLIRASRKLGSNDYKSLNSLKNEINSAKFSGSPSQSAERMLRVLAKYIPLLINSSPRLKSALY